MKENKQVGIWIPVSTDMQVESESPEHHELRGRSYATAKNWQEVEIYRLEAISGKSVMEHPETKRMLKTYRTERYTVLFSPNWRDSPETQKSF